MSLHTFFFHPIAGFDFQRICIPSGFAAGGGPPGSSDRCDFYAEQLSEINTGNHSVGGFEPTVPQKGCIFLQPVNEADDYWSDIRLKDT